MNGWKSVRVADIAAPGSNSMSTGPFGSSIGARFFHSSGVPIIRGGNLSSESGVRLQDKDDLVFLKPAKAAEFSRSTVRRGDLVFTCWGTINQVGLIDKSARYDSYVISNKQMKLTPDPAIADSEFLYYLFSGPQMQREILDGSIGSSIPGFNLTRLRNLVVALPPLGEQRAIAHSINDASDQISSLERLIVKKQAIKQGMMQLLLTGRTRLPGFTEPWVSAPFGDLAAPARERVLPRSVNQHTRLVELEHLDAGSGRLSGSSEAGDAISLKTVFRSGDVLFGKLRAYLRKFWLADGGGLCSTEVWALRARPGVADGFIRYVVETDRFIEVASGGYGTHMPRSDWGVVRKLEIALPPMDEQEAISNLLYDADSEVRALRDRLTKARVIKTGMMQQLLTGRTRLPLEASS